jgi:phosphoglycolate phosphatase-like HAD superfamily hydrolase
VQLSSIIFDMDGVLIDSEPVHKLAKKRAFERFGIFENYRSANPPLEPNVTVVVTPVVGRTKNIDGATWKNAERNCSFFSSGRKVGAFAIVALTGKIVSLRLIL